MSKSNKYDRETLLFMSEVDQAMYGKGHKLAYLMSTAILLLIVFFIIWAHFAVLDETTRGMGRVIPSQRIQEIQNLEGGILNELFVQEGQTVEKGDILARLSNEQAASYYRDAFSKALEHKAAIARLLAEADVTGEPVFPEEVMKEAPQLAEDQLRIYKAQQNKMAIEIGMLEDQFEQRQQEINEMIGRRRQLQQSLEVAEKQRNIAKPLVEKQIHSELDYLRLEQTVVQLKGDVEALSLGIPRVRRAAKEAQGRIDQAKAEYRTNALEEINERRQELKSLMENLSSGGDRVTRTDVRSPVRGIVKHIMVNTLGGVVRPGESIMEVVPLDDTLLVEAEIKPSDIAFLHPGQKAKVKVTAYDFSIYGGLEGTVENISADTIENEKKENYYLVKVRTKENSILYQGQHLPIIPGMTATVDVLTGEKSVLDYLLKPILKAKQNALRER
ncbi:MULTISPECIES: HlyD family type I secretion periplasmic adaptor subunit [unclassified Pseudodesulfovibrio]|uniref:HlyD family type I secretion periplasmic adaptor subunit n=1 Tax=unclassified Pseudodesulfovibrio TaxID=2661612 RepID=UPI000FEC0B9D|nr:MULTISPECIES: HlyD family type I secretion periplasmic adaptor subunit [unclassified Pseudodesulfovibrio]MCJ2163469.1 HlyD family type I secretion periplasmic adaptor subunit [Pseudodesulfovibrio sp. S3-i]RWU06874.1 HlyD family type I secretion periplasmic adaptor subunit [Pseudodesulfovibrio sp. S3]